MFFYLRLGVPVQGLLRPDGGVAGDPSPAECGPGVHLPPPDPPQRDQGPGGLCPGGLRGPQAPPAARRPAQRLGTPAPLHHQPR